MKTVVIWLSIICFIPQLSQAQEKVMSLKEYYQLVGNFHPIARQAKLLNEQGRMTVRQARGLFDPKIVAEYNSKRQGDKDYYNLWESYLEIPTLLNVDFKAGYESTDGLFLNPENTTPTDGLYYAGLSIPLGQGLINNQRNTELKKSRFVEQEFQNQSVLVLNSLILDANYTYWNWYENDQKIRVVQNSLALASDRLNWIREAVLTGENAAIDSVESLIQVQNWRNALLAAEVALTNSHLKTNNFIWADSLATNEYVPQNSLAFSNLELQEILDQIPFTHPEVKKFLIKSEILDLDRKLSAEMMKPQLDLNYNFLLTQQGNQPLAPFTNDYRMGVEFAFPIFIRKERAKLQLAKLKIRENDLVTSEKIRKISNNVRQAYNKVLAIREMIAQQELILRNYISLFEAEQIKFNNGESSVFLLNSRENMKLENEIKLIELKSKFGQAIGELKFSAGILHKEIEAIN